jgi:hypothetical protein
MNCFRRFVALFVAVPLFALVGHAASVDDVITQARRYIGKERDLAAVRTLHYRGTITVAGPIQASGTLEMLLQQPNFQKTIRVLGDKRETVGLDDTEGWVRAESVAKPALGRTDMVPPAQLRLLRASAVENLSFYRGLEKFGGRTEGRGETTFEGKAAVRVAFIHPGEVTFVRTFDKATGRLLVTQGPGGEEIREEGELVVANLRFPQRLISTAKNAEGGEFVVTIVFEEVRVNESFPPDTFAVPMPGAK